MARQMAITASTSAARGVVTAATLAIGVGLERRQCRQCPSLYLELVSADSSARHPTIHIRKPRRGRLTRRPARTLPNLFHTRNNTRIESDGETHICRTPIAVLAAELESRPREEDASPGEKRRAPSTTTSKEPARTNAMPPTARYLSLRIVVHLVRGMVEAVDR